MATLTETFTNIADAIRLKTETTDKITPENMPAMIEGISVGSAAVVQELSITSNGVYKAPEDIDGYNPIIVSVPQDGAPPASNLNLTASLDYMFYAGVWDWFVNQYGPQITTKDITSTKYMFTNSNLKNIPFEINLIPGNSTRTAKPDLSYIFSDAKYLTTVPKISGRLCSRAGMFKNCYRLKKIPEDIDSWFDYSKRNDSSTDNGIFEGCFALRSIPMNFLNHYSNQYPSSSIYYQGFYACYALDEIVDLPVCLPTGNWLYGNAFGNTFDNCSRLKTLTFEKNADGSVINGVEWGYQTINLESVGYLTRSDSQITNYSGITTDFKVVDDTTYQALKDNPDYWTADFNYSRYNKISAIETINSLPAISASVNTNSNPNTIKFKGAAGALTDGGAINTMTEEEIAVATAKGWTVSFA